MLIRESQLQMPFLTQTINVCEYPLLLHWCLEDAYLRWVGREWRGGKGRDQVRHTCWTGSVSIACFVEEGEEGEGLV